MERTKHRAFDRLGNIAIVNFSKGVSAREKKKFARKILKENKSIKTVLEKVGRVKGRLRKISTRYLAGEKTKEVLYKENGCVFRFNIDTTYFSPRLSNERKEIASKIKKDDEVLVMFAGVGPYPIVIARNSKAKKVYSNEINREANKYAELNIDLNNLKNKIELLPGDVKKVAGKIGSLRSRLMTPRQTLSRRSAERIANDKTSLNLYEKFRAERGGKFNGFDVIVMPRPQLKNTFLKEAFSLSRKGTRIFYYDFTKISPKKNFCATKSKTAPTRRGRGKDFVGCRVDEINSIIEKIKLEAKKAKKKIKILKKKKAGEIAPYKIRLRVDFVVV